MPIIEKQEEATEKPSESSEPEKKIVKITTLSSQERLEMRAKKFSGNGSATAASETPSDDKLTARAARFGITAPTTSSTAKTITGPTAVSDEVLKKRAERFGAISTDVKKIELNEKLQKRKERFGVAGKAVVSSTTTADQAEKARLRLERFKQTA
jgi:SAP domain-containing ribonucleoprotein